MQNCVLHVKLYSFTYSILHKFGFCKKRTMYRYSVLYTGNKIECNTGGFDFCKKGTIFFPKLPVLLTRNFNFLLKKRIGWYIHSIVFVSQVFILKNITEYAIVVKERINKHDKQQ